MDVGKKILLPIASDLCESDGSEVDMIIDTSSSSSSDEEDAHSLFTITLLRQQRGKLQKRSRIQNYVKGTIPKYSAEEFKSHFRMTPDTFHFVLGLIGRAVSETKYVRGRKPVGKATAIRSVRRVSYAVHCLAPRFIQWPSGEKAQDLMCEYRRNSGFPGVIRAIDGTHITINAPREDAHSYVNRKGCHSIQMQAVCTHNMLFTSVFAGNVGCVHDSRVFRLSSIQNYIETPDVFFPDDSHIIGDAAYGIHPHAHVRVPFKDNHHLTERQKNFNFCLSSGRMAIERTFGFWKGRWRSIRDCLSMITIEKIPEFLLATCVLHNICVLRGDMVTPDEVLRVRRRGNLTSNRKIEGENKRLNIMNSLAIRN